MLYGWAWTMVPSDHLVLSSKARADHVVCWMSIWQVYWRNMCTLDLTKVGGRLAGAGGSGDRGGEEKGMGVRSKGKEKAEQAGMNQSGRGGRTNKVRRDGAA